MDEILKRVSKWGACYGKKEQGLDQNSEGLRYQNDAKICVLL